MCESFFVLSFRKISLADFELHRRGPSDSRCIQGYPFSRVKKGGSGKFLKNPHSRPIHHAYVAG
jgi:hypothetical protein